MNDLAKLLPLERCLKHLSENSRNTFPGSRDDYIDIYLRLKAFVKSEVAKWIGGTSSAIDGNLYTDHSIDHFNAVIRSAGMLLEVCNENPEDDELDLNGYEIFILLSAILLHDSGMIEGRDKHEQKTLKILNESGVMINKLESRPIAKIAAAHGGKRVQDDGSHSKDTIGVLDEHGSFSGVKYRPKLIAALVRFADEICEDFTRSSSVLEAFDAVPTGSQIYHKYARSISSVDFDVKSKRIDLVFEILKSDATIKYGKDSSENNVYLVDEILERLKKMYLEMKYCSRFFNELIKIEAVRAKVSFFEAEDELDSIHSESIEFVEKGYPSLNQLIDSEFPEFSGKLIAQKFKEEVK